MPRLQVEENLQMVTVMSIASGTMEKSDRRRILHGWYRIQGEKRAQHMPQSREQRQALLASMGIKLEWRKN